MVASVYFVDGCVIEKDYVYVTSRLDDVDPNRHEHSRLFFDYRGKWFSHDLEWNVRSVCVRRATGPRQCCALSIQGEVEYQTTAGATCEQISGAGIRDGAGAMTEIREIGQTLFACGFGGQVYRKTRNRWRSISAGLMKMRRVPDITSIDGRSATDLYAVGFFGRIFHFDGRRWREIESPTKANLERVRVHGRRVYACGKAGTLLAGDRNGFTMYQAPNADDLWGLCVHRGAVYASGLEELYRFGKKAFTRIDTGLERALTFYRLDARDGVLWSFGPKDLLTFDGVSWARVPHPDNDVVDHSSANNARGR